MVVSKLAMVDQKIIESSRRMVSVSSCPETRREFENGNDQLKKLDHKDWLAPNQVVRIFRSLRDPNLVISAFEKVSKRMDYKPNEALYSEIIEKLAYARKYDVIEDLFARIKSEKCRLSEEFFYKIIKIYGLCKQGRVDEAIDLLDQMRLKGCSPNSNSYQAVLYGLLSCEKFVKAKEFMELMHSKGIFPSFLSYKMLIEGLCRLNLLEDVDLMLKQMVSQGFAPRMGTWRKILESMPLQNAFSHYHL